jgi:hypothetical protein
MKLYEATAILVKTECEYVIGIFSTKDKAEKACNEAIKNNKIFKNTLKIIEFELDKAN